MVSTVKHMAREGDEVFLPDEIVINILKRLPIESLTRFQCVCKQWRNLFKTPYFIIDRLQNSSYGKACRLLDQLLVSETPMGIAVGVKDASMINCFSHDVRVIGRPSKGLFCLELHNGNSEISPNPLLLWNARIKEVTQVPRTVDDFKGDCYLGFGFSRVVNDYKIVRGYAPKFNNNEINRVEVYSLRKGSWKEVEFERLRGIISLGSESVMANGAMYWVGTSKRGHDLIVSFDIAEEVFRLIPMPPTLRSRFGFGRKPTSYPISSPKLFLLQNRFAIHARFTVENSETQSLIKWCLLEDTNAPRKWRTEGYIVRDDTVVSRLSTVLSALDWVD